MWRLLTGFLPSSAAASNIYIKPPYAIGSVPSLSGHAVAYRWRSLPRVRRHRASKPQGSSERVLPWQVTMDQIICASLSHTHYRYEFLVGMLKVPAGPVFGGTSCCCFSHSRYWLPTRKKILYTVANPARGLLNRGGKNKKKSLAAHPLPPTPPIPPHCSSDTPFWVASGILVS